MKKIIFYMFLLIPFINKPSEVNYIPMCYVMGELDDFIFNVREGDFKEADEILKEHPQFAYKPFETPRDGLFTPLIYIIEYTAKNKLDSIYYLLTRGATTTINFKKKYYDQNHKVTAKKNALQIFIQQNDLYSINRRKILNLLLSASASYK